MQTDTKGFRTRTAAALYSALIAEQPEEAFMAEDSELFAELSSVLTHTILNIDTVSLAERQQLVSSTLRDIGVTDPGQLLQDEELAENFQHAVWAFFCDRALRLWRAIGGHMELRPETEENLPRRFNEVPEGGGALFYVVCGQLTVSCEGYKKTIQAGELAIVPQKSLVEFWLAEDCEYCSAFNLSFIEQERMSYLPFEQSPFRFLHIALDNELARRNVHDALTRIIDISHSTIEHRQQLILNLVDFVLIFCSDACSAESSSRIDPRVQHACDFIRAHYAEKLTIDDISTAAGISASALTSLFKNHIGINMMRWRDQLRMEKAVELLEGTERAVKAIAIEVGYDDPLFFSRRFKQITGWSPSQVRASRR